MDGERARRLCRTEKPTENILLDFTIRKSGQLYRYAECKNDISGWLVRIVLFRKIEVYLKRLTCRLEGRDFYPLYLYFAVIRRILFTDSYSPS